MISFIQDASVYELTFQSIQSPENLEGLHQLVLTSLQSKTPITMRAGGTSLGGQAIGSGVIIDVSKHLNTIVEYHPERKEVVVEPGVIQDDLNDFVAADGLRFAPDTSTSNRAMIGGMIGNNSCGSYSVLYGTTREHVKSVEVILSDGSEVMFSDLSADAL
ncbi:MAG: FAD-binding oxidoreductase, partial [Thiomicrorhabdus sp.]|nr:FAD-binding oxidoreductase [Thiomicrorhabdus sp.]